MWNFIVGGGGTSDNEEHYISVPGQITPNAMYDIIVDQCGRLDEHLLPLSWQDPRQLQVAILTMIEFSYLYLSMNELYTNI